MAEGSGLTANINLSQVSLLQNIEKYLQQNCVPGGTKRNWKSYGLKVNHISEHSINILCDPQTSGGLLVVSERMRLRVLRSLYSLAKMFSI